MGYETTLYIGLRTTQTTSAIGKENVYWFKEFARIQLGKVGDMGEAIPMPRRKKLPEVFFYGDDGNTEIFEDRYEDKLRAYPPKIIIEYLKKMMAENDEYPKGLLTIKVLEEMQTWGYKPYEVCCILFGH